MKAINAVQAVCLIILGSLIISDINTRFGALNSDAVNKNSLHELEDYNKRQLSSQQMLLLNSLYVDFSEPTDDSNNELNKLDGKFEGDPTKVLLNEHLLELKAIVSVATDNVNHRDNYVLIKDTDLKSNLMKIVRVDNKQIIHGFELNLIDNRHIRLIPKDVNSDSDLGENITKEHILAMYRRTEPSQAGKKE